MRTPDKNNNKFRSNPIFFIFPCKAFGDVVRHLVGLVKESLKVSNFQAQLMTFSGFIILGFVAGKSALLLGIVVLVAAILYINVYNFAGSKELI
jgi:hypothetical protein